MNYQIFGGSVGGPIIRDRTFFHAHYERFIDDFEEVDFLTVPSLAMTQGDFSGAGAHGPIPQLYDPFNVVDGRRAPFDGNIVPQGRWSPVYQELMQLIPPPGPNVPGATDRNYSYPSTDTSRINKYSIRGDHHLASDDTVFGRFSWQNTPQTVHRPFYGVPGEELHGVARRFLNGAQGWQMAMGWVNPVGSNLVTELNASLWGLTWQIGKPLEDRDWAGELGYDDARLHPVYFEDGSRGSGGLPIIAPTGYPGWRGDFDQPLSDWGLGVKYTASWRRGDHYLKFGVEHSRNLDVQYRWIPAYGNGGDFYDGFATGQITRAPDGSSTGATFGEPWADLALGLPSLVNGNNLGLDSFIGTFNQSHYNWFINDDWKVGPNLTLNLGLRWEQPRPPYYEGSPDGKFASDYYYCAFDYSKASDRIDPVQTTPGDFDIAQWQGGGGLGVPFSNLDRRGCYEARWSYFAPRFGLAWRMFGSNRTVLRLGAGLTYDQDFGQMRARVMRPALGLLNSIRPRGTENPSLFTGQRLDLPTQTVLGEYSTCYFYELDWEEGQVYSYNLSLQHEIFQGTKLEVGYVGNQGRHIREVSPFNTALPEGYVAPLVGGGTATLTSDAITAGPRPWIPGDTQSRSWSGQRARRPYPQVVSNVMQRPDGNTSYNSLQAKLERRFQDGVALSLGYTWSKAMALNLNGTWGEWSGSRAYERHTLKAPMAHDRAQTFYTSAIWQLPFFRSSGGLARTLLGGWEATTIATLTSGAPYRVWYGRDLWNLGPRSSIYPDRVAHGYLGEDERSVDHWFDTSAFVAPVYDSSLCPGDTLICHEAARGALGNSAANPLRYDGVPLVDISLHKEFAFGEGKAVGLRVDFFNAFNHAIFEAPIGNVASRVAGRVVRSAAARQIQFGFRFSF